jgi:signal transduction histidine kinase
MAASSKATLTATPPAPPFRHVVVEGRFQETDKPAGAASADERRLLNRRVRDLAVQVAAKELWFVGAMWIVQVPLQALRPDHRLSVLEWTWGAGMTAMAVAMGWLARRPERSTPALLASVVTVASLLAALPPWWAPAEWQLVSALLASCFGILAATAVTPARAAALMFALMPFVACNGIDAPGSFWSLAGAIVSLATAALSWRTFDTWRRTRVELLQQLEQIRSVERQLDAAQRTDEDKSRFLAIASHDLRQPVHALGLFAATLQRRLQRTPDESLARSLMQAIDGLERSFNAILDVSRLDGGALVPRLQTFPLRDMFRRLHMLHAGQAEFAGLGLRFSPGGKSVTSDPQLLERIVGNLVQNAIKYTSRGGIVVVARSTAQAVNIEVWDTGCGIAAQDLPRIFDEFYQVGRTDRERSHGLGMGLAIVKRLAKLLGHRLEVHSTPGRGTMFRVGVAIGGLPGLQDELAPADTLPMAIETPRMVLVVDDEEAIREGLRALLQEWGYQVMTAADSLQAERAVAMLEGRVDLVLSDLHLGEGPDGAEVIENIRRLCGRDVPAVLVTGETSRDEVSRVTAGGDPVLFKPVHPRRLFEVLQSMLG